MLKFKCTDCITCKNGISIELITKLLGKLVLYSAGVQHMHIWTKIPLLKEVRKSSKTGHGDYQVNVFWLMKS